MPKLIVGLGNPGPRYAKTRHNVGWMAVDAFARKQGCNLDRIGHHGQYGELRWTSGEKVILLKPMTYMNLSGRSVLSAARFFKIDPYDMLVVYDDMDTPVGMLRLREQGSSGGQKGVQSIIQELATQSFPRIRIGIGRPEPGWDSADWVLSGFGADDAPLVTLALERAVSAMEVFLSENFGKAMNLFNGTGPGGG